MQAELGVRHAEKRRRQTSSSCSQTTNNKLLAVSTLRHSVAKGSLHEHSGGHATADRIIPRVFCGCCKAKGFSACPACNAVRLTGCALPHMPQAEPLVERKRFLSRGGAAFCLGRIGREPESTHWPGLHLQVDKTLAMQHVWSFWLEVAGSVLTCGSQRAASGPAGLGNRPGTCPETVRAERSCGDCAARSARNREGTG